MSWKSMLGKIDYHRPFEEVTTCPSWKRKSPPVPAGKEEMSSSQSTVVPWLCAPRGGKSVRGSHVLSRITTPKDWVPGLS